MEPLALLTICPAVIKKLKNTRAFSIQPSAALAGASCGRIGADDNGIRFKTCTIGLGVERSGNNNRDVKKMNGVEK